MEQNQKDSSVVLDEARRHLAQGNLGMALARALDAAELDHPDAVMLVALMYFAGVGIQRNLETAAQYANKYIELSPEGAQVKEAKYMLDGTLGTENAKRLVFGSKSLNNAAYKNLGGPLVVSKSKNVTWAIVGLLVLLLAFTGVYFYKTHKQSATDSSTTEQKVSSTSGDGQAASKDAKPKDINENIVVSELKSSNTSIVETKDGQKIIRSGDLVIKVPKD